MPYLTDQRAELGALLAGTTLTLADALESVKAFPALVVTPGPVWLDGQVIPSGAGRAFALSLTVTLLVGAAEADAGLRALEEAAEEVLERLPVTWRFDRAETPYRARAGELSALACDLVFSLTASIT